MSALGNRELPIPEHIDIFHVQREMPPSDKTAIQCVMEADMERQRLEKEAEELASKNSEGNFIFLINYFYIPVDDHGLYSCG